ncbi:MAG: NAD-dependent epimerase/dehydratase family protein [Deltaproteobacteria bacterium]|nr:NAD-dependent epimerase/dehydratase family protein [Deltaproteobacteria bacterium]
MKILVTGGAGFIGSNVVDGYVREGHEVVVLDDLSTGRRENLNSKARFYAADIRSDRVEEIMTEERPQILNHHAAQISVPVSVADPVRDADINIGGLLNLLQSAVRHGVKKVIFISSGGAIYGEATEYPTTESYLPQPLSPYAVSKLASEYYLAWCKHAHGLEFTVLRYANVYGPRQISHGEAGVVSIFMENLLQGRPSTLNHFPEDEEGMIRDYCYVGDVVRANLKAVSGGDGGVFNIGTTRETRTLQLYRMIYEAVREIRPETSPSLASPLKQPARQGDIKRSCLAVKRAGEEFGWFPETDVPSGLRLTLRWWLETRANRSVIPPGKS